LSPANARKSRTSGFCRLEIVFTEDEAIETTAHRTVLKIPWRSSLEPYVKVSNSVKDRILKRFNDEISALERELKLELPKEIQRARELGDLRENAEYKAAKERQELVNARIAMLKKRVSEIALVNLDRIPRDRAGFGSTVHLRDDNGDTLVYQLVMPEDADAEKGMISTSSPIGRAILNKEEGDDIKVVTPSGNRQFELVKLITIHDEA
jgi:transcription elongation factor GreA